MSNAERRSATQDDLFTLKGHQLQVLNLIRENELTIAELRVATGTKYPNRRICEIEAQGFEIIRGSVYAGEGLALTTYRYAGNVVVPSEATCSA
jgi:hypothetical protein